MRIKKPRLLYLAESGAHSEADLLTFPTKTTSHHLVFQSNSWDTAEVCPAPGSEGRMTDHLLAAEPFLVVRVRCQKSFNWQISQVQKLEELAFCLKIVQT